MFLVANKLGSPKQMKNSLQAAGTACFDWNLLLWPSKQGFCAGSADTWKNKTERHKESGSTQKRLFRSRPRMTFIKQRGAVNTYCVHSASLPLLWYSIMHCIKWWFSSSIFVETVKIASVTQVTQRETADWNRIWRHGYTCPRFSQLQPGWGGKKRNHILLVSHISIIYMKVAPRSAFKTRLDHL